MKARASQDTVIIIETTPAELEILALLLSVHPNDPGLSIYGTIRPKEGFEIRFINKPLPQAAEKAEV